MLSNHILFLIIGCVLGWLLAIGVRRIKERSQKQKITAFSYIHEKERNFSVTGVIEDFLQSLEAETEDRINQVELVLNLLQRETFTSLLTDFQ